MKILAAFALLLSIAMAYPAYACDGDKNKDDKEKTPQTSSYQETARVPFIY